MEPVVLNPLLLTLSLDTTQHRVEEYTIEMSLHFVYFNYFTLKADSKQVWVGIFVWGFGDFFFPSCFFLGGLFFVGFLLGWFFF